MLSGRFVTHLNRYLDTEYSDVTCYMLVIFTEAVGRLSTSETLIKPGMKLIAILRKGIKMRGVKCKEHTEC
jgi:hypothetical protein